MATTAQEPDFVIEDHDRDIETMPNLDPEPMEAVQAPPPPMSMPARPLVDMMVATVEVAMRGMIPKHLPPGCPEPPSAISDSEKEVLAAAAQPVIDKWLPHVGDKPELILLITAGAIFAPRIMAARAINEWSKQAPPPVQQAQVIPQAPRPPVPVQDEDAWLTLGDRSVASMVPP